MTQTKKRYLFALLSFQRIRTSLQVVDSYSQWYFTLDWGGLCVWMGCSTETAIVKLSMLNSIFGRCEMTTTLTASPVTSYK